VDSDAIFVNEWDADGVTDPLQLRGTSLWLNDLDRETVALEDSSEVSVPHERLVEKVVERVPFVEEEAETDAALEHVKLTELEAED
jgi:hypothetical protein